MDDRATTLKGRCLPYGEGITFWPIAEIAREVTGIGEGKQPEEVAANVAALLPDDESASDVVRAVADATGVADTSADTQEIAWAVRRLFEALARKRPLIVVFDDIHWAEATFLDLIEDLSAQPRGPDARLCAWPRRADRAAAGLGSRDRGCRQARGSNRSRARAATLIGKSSGREAAARSTADRVNRRGQAAFLQEILRMLADDGCAAASRRAMGAVGELSDVAIPPTIRALLAARLDRLSPANGSSSNERPSSDWSSARRGRRAAA